VRTFLPYLTAALIAAAPFASHAQASAPGSTANPPYAVSVERLSLGKAKGKFGETAFSVADYMFAGRTGVSDVSGPFSVDVLGSSRKVKRVTVVFRFTRADGAPVVSGLCSMRTRMWSGLWNTAENSLYACDFKDAPQDTYSLEAVVPGIEAESDAMVSFTAINPEKYKVLKARLRYKGVVYEAVPTGFHPEREYDQRRVADGYTISRDGQLVGRIDFPDYKGTIVDFAGSYDRNGTFITAPVAEADGREAVIFFAGHLFNLPEANAPALLR
jgi:hypothetical protein